MPPKSIFRQPGAKHFQLVHRSQRDPLIHDPDASKHVLKQIVPQNAKKGKSRADLEALLAPSELQQPSQNVGEAAEYGIYYDDTEYDYMQHLRTVGVQEDGVDSILIEAPSSSRSKKSKGIELPKEALPSTSELPRTYESQQAIPESIAGFQPDMDPHLRQTLEALEDDAFVDDGLEDDFFGDLLGQGERGSNEDVQFEFNEYGVEESPAGADHDDEEAGWEERFKQFKISQAATGPRSDDGSEGADTVGTLPAIPAIGGKKRRKGTSDASGYSMSSSSMYRNEALQTLDERFDQMVSKQYNEEDDETNSPSSDDEDEDEDEAPELITTREDFESMMDEFLNDYEILGRKMKLKLEGDTGADKLDTIRRAMGQDERVRLVTGDEDDNNEILEPFDIDNKQDRWDCETILTTYSNLENHPRIIRIHDSKPVKKIILDPKTGLPSIADTPQRKLPAIEPESDSGSETDTPCRHTITRPRNESKEDKKARKAAVKAERQARRVDKKATKDQFSEEMKAQMRTIGNKERKTRKL